MENSWDSGDLHRRPIFYRPQLPPNFQQEQETHSNYYDENNRPSSSRWMPAYGDQQQFYQHSEQQTHQTRRFQPKMNTIHATLRRFNRNFEIPFENQAEDIVNTMRQNEELMQDTPVSEQRRKDAVRQMTQSMSMKRCVNERLTNSLARNTRMRSIGCWTNLKYQSRTKWNRIREHSNLNFELWYGALKEIEGKYGSGYASYFKFFRWLFVFNLFTAILTFIFIVLPQIIFDNNKSNSSSSRSFSFSDIFTGYGYFTDTVLYYGHYTNNSVNLVGNNVYDMPTAYFTVMVLAYLLSFFILCFSTARSYRRSFIETAGGLQNAYANRIFCGWDFSIFTEEAAKLKSSAIFREFKELLSDELNQSRVQTCCSKFQNFTLQTFAHLLILSGNGLIGWGLWRLLDEFSLSNDRNLIVVIAVVVNLIVICLPTLFSYISNLENYSSPRVKLNITLFRTFLLGAVILGVILTFFITNATKFNCWETLLAEEMYRLIIFEFIFSFILTPLFEILSYFVVKVFSKGNKPEFNIAKHSMLIIYNQGLLWVGLLYSPILPIIVTVKMFLIWYMRELTLGWLYGPPKKSWRAAQAQTWFKMIALVTNLLIIVVHAFTLTNVNTSVGCGPFRNYAFIYEFLISNFRDTNTFFTIVLFITRPGVVAFIAIFIAICVYYTRELAMIQKLKVLMLREMLAMQGKDKKYLIDQIKKLSGRVYTMRDNRFASFGTADGRSSYQSDPQQSAGDYNRREVENLPVVQPQYEEVEVYREETARRGSLYSGSGYSMQQEPTFYEHNPQNHVQESINNIDDIVEERFSKYSKQ